LFIHENIDSGFKIFFCVQLNRESDFSLNNRGINSKRRRGLINQCRARCDVILARSRVRDKEIIAVTCNTSCARKRRKLFLCESGGDWF